MKVDNKYLMGGGSKYSYRFAQVLVDIARNIWPFGSENKRFASYINGIDLLISYAVVCFYYRSIF